jgi:hypothetical protein
MNISSFAIYLELEIGILQRWINFIEYMHITTRCVHIRVQSIDLNMNRSSNISFCVTSKSFEVYSSKARRF